MSLTIPKKPLLFPKDNARQVRIAASLLSHKLELRYKRPTLTASDFLAHAFGLSYALSRFKRLECPSRPKSPPAITICRDPSTTQGAYEYDRLYIAPPIGTFRSSLLVNSLRTIAEAPESLSSLCSPRSLPSSQRSSYGLPSDPSALPPSVEHEPFMTHDEWLENSVDRMERRRLRRIFRSVGLWRRDVQQDPVSIDSGLAGGAIGLDVSSADDTVIRRVRKKKFPASA